MAKHLTHPQRYYICIRIASFDSIKNIAKMLNVDKSTVYREIKRNQKSPGEYDSAIAHKKAITRRQIASGEKGFKKLTKKNKFIYKGKART